MSVFDEQKTFSLLHAVKCLYKEAGLLIMKQDINKIKETHIDYSMANGCNVNARLKGKRFWKPLMLVIRNF